MKTKKLIWILVMIALINSVFAIPTPLGIDGRIYELDGLTEVFSGFPVIINDTTSGFVREVNTGKGSSGRYSLAISGQVGDNIIVSVSNPLFNSSRNITLTGVIHDFDLTINMSLPDLPPEIKSMPENITLEDELYTYEIDVIDWNGESLSYNISGPSEMFMNENTINWVPNDSDVGIHEIRIDVSDSNSTTTQIYNLEVINVNEPPNITSVPLPKIAVGHLYKYQIIAEDPDGDNLTYKVISDVDDITINGSLVTWIPYPWQLGNTNVTVEVSDGELKDTEWFIIEVTNNSIPEIISTPTTSAKVKKTYTYQVSVVDVDDESHDYEIEGPSGMSIDDQGLVSWIPTKDQLGEHNVEITVSDNSHEGTQEYKITVSKSKVEKPKKRKGGGSGGGGGFIHYYHDKKEEKQDKEEKFDDALLEIIHKTGGKVFSKVLTSRPSIIKNHDKFVYKYLSIDGDPDGAFIKFKVENQWLNRRNIKPNQIVLARYLQKWDELPTDNIGEDEKTQHYESETPGFSYFAITVKEEADAKLPEPVIEKIKEPFLIFGKITNNRGKEVSSGTPIVIENKDSGEIIVGQTGGPSSGAYQVVLHGSKEDQIIFTVGDKYQEEVSFRLKDSKLNLNIRIPGEGFNKITGNVIRFTGENKLNLGIIVLMILLISLLVAMLKREKNEKEPPEKPLTLEERGNYEI